MKTLYSAVLITALIAPLGAPIHAGPIDRACISSPREASSYRLCRCIQRVANDTLTRTDQRKAAEFFTDPQKAQDTRQSDVPSNERFWKRYTHFGELAAALCG